MKVAQRRGEVAQPQPEVAQRQVKVAQPRPEVAQPRPEVAQRQVKSLILCKLLLECFQPQITRSYCGQSPHS